MKTETLIQELAAQIRPVTPVGHPLARFGWWAAFTAAWVAAAVSALGVRADLAAVSRGPTFLLQVALPLGLGAAATVAAFVASVPGRKNHYWIFVPAAVMALWLATVVSGALTAGGAHIGAGLRCIRNLIAFSVPPGALLYFMLRQAAPLERGAIGMLAAVGVAAFGHAGTRFVCHNDGAWHALVWHCGFVTLVGGLGIILGRALLLPRVTRLTGQRSVSDR